ncbi:MAG: YkgJ family cysteine cluster protein [Lachnospiraceae bacterium]|nr:YkgJ family cysteine cluster protein [Lachnospiraceae bacterium]
MKQIKEFQCMGEKCPNHCCGSFDGISQRLRAIGTISFQEILLLPEDKDALCAIGREDLIVEKENGLAIIKTAPDGTCEALTGGKCGIYPARPAICRCYPLYMDLFTGICVDEKCPAVSGLSYEAVTAEAKEALLKVYAYWLKYYAHNVY